MSHYQRTMAPPTMAYGGGGGGYAPYGAQAHQQQPAQHQQPPQQQYWNEAPQLQPQPHVQAPYAGAADGAMGRAEPPQPVLGVHKGVYKLTLGTEEGDEDTVSKVGRQLPEDAIGVCKGGYLDAVVSYVESAEAMSVQPLDKLVDIATMTRRIKEAAAQLDNEPHVINPPRGTALLAKYSADGIYYRAVLIGRPEPAVYTVYFCDFGNESRVQAVDTRRCPQTMLAVPPLALRCATLARADVLRNKVPNFAQDMVDRYVVLQPSHVTPEARLCCDVLLLEQVGGGTALSLSALANTIAHVALPPPVRWQSVYPALAAAVEKAESGAEPPAALEHNAAAAAAPAPLDTAAQGGFGGGGGATTGFGGGDAMPAFGGGGGGGGAMKCFNCQQEGHRSAECPNPRTGNNKCFNCQEEGHRASDCTAPRVVPAGRQPDRPCFVCRQEGHWPSDCPKADSITPRGVCRHCDGTGHWSFRCAQNPRANRQQANTGGGVDTVASGGFGGGAAASGAFGGDSSAFGAAGGGFGGGAAADAFAGGFGDTFGAKENKPADPFASGFDSAPAPEPAKATTAPAEDTFAGGFGDIKESKTQTPPPAVDSAPPEPQFAAAPGELPGAPQEEAEKDGFDAQPEPKPADAEQPVPPAAAVEPVDEQGAGAECVTAQADDQSNATSGVDAGVEDDAHKGEHDVPAESPSAGDTSGVAVGQGDNADAPPAEPKLQLPAAPAQAHKDTAANATPTPSEDSAPPAMAPYRLVSAGAEMSGCERVDGNDRSTSSPSLFHLFTGGLHDELINKLSAFECDEDDKPSDNELTVGSLVSAFYEDGMYRGEVRSVCDGQVRVYFVDYGNGGATSECAVRRVPAALAAEHRLCIRCSLHNALPQLHGGQWSDKQLDKFDQLVPNNELVTVRVVGAPSADGVHGVTVTNKDGVDVGDAINKCQ